MSGHVMVVDAVALLVAATGFHLAFRQRLVRRLWSIVNGGKAPGQHREAKPQGADEQDPVHYALIISGTMIMAFGILIFTFTTIYGS